MSGRTGNQEWMYPLHGIDGCLGIGTGSLILDFDGNLPQVVKEIHQNGGDGRIVRRLDWDYGRSVMRWGSSQRTFSDNNRDTLVVIRITTYASYTSQRSYKERRDKKQKNIPFHLCLDFGLEQR